MQPKPGRDALANNCAILCDVGMVKQGVTKRMITRELLLCFLNDPRRRAELSQKGKGLKRLYGGAEFCGKTSLRASVGG